MTRSCPKCNEAIPAKAEWCPHCLAIAPGTILPGWALVFGLLFLGASLTCLYLLSLHFKPNYLMALGPCIPLAYKYLATYFRLTNRHMPSQSA
jgi:hypothetical protein